ncbi:MAG: hypothetical protein ABIF11_10320 [Nitrospirota bacterium]
MNEKNLNALGDVGDGDATFFVKGDKGLRPLSLELKFAGFSKLKSEINGKMQ